MKICIIGNSKRHKILKENLEKIYSSVSFYDTSNKIPEKLDYDFIVLPIPTLKSNGKININDNTELDIEKILKASNENTVFVSCNYSNNNYKIIDINTRDDFAFLNAIPTAEGAIKLAVDNLDVSLFYSKILITGFGRVSKVLANRLKGLCPNITIVARSLKDRAYAETLGFNVCDYETLKNSIYEFDIIFQTVPNLVITSELLKLFNKNTIIIELSSKSVGTDFNYAEKVGIKVIHAPALPEKIAPITAGNILTKTVLEIINETTQE